MQFIVSWPPSTNQIWRAINGRNILSAKARDWFKTASQEIAAQGGGQVKGQVSIEILLSPPHKRRFDLDNRVKPVLDLLVKNFVIEDDDCRFVRRFSVSLGDGFVGALVRIHSI